MKSILSTIAVSASLITGSAHAAEKAPIVLVHGAFEDASVWQQTKTKLEADGYKVIAVNLPGRPSNPMAMDKISLATYTNEVVKAISGEKRAVVLVGHSFGGITISAVGEAVPEKIRTLVFLAAGLPKDGDSLFSLATSDKDGKLGPRLIFDKEKGIASVDYAYRADLFANDGSEGLRKAIPDLILDEPLAPLAEPVHVTAARFGQIDKVYIHTAKDQVVSPSSQAAMVSATPVRFEITLDTGHTPFLTSPAALVDAIEKAAK